MILSDLAAFSHIVTRLKLIPDAARDPALSEIERTRGTDYAQKLSVRTLSRAWQILLKGIPEVQASNRPVAAAEMVLVRLAYAADLPTPDEALRALKDGAPVPSGGPSARRAAALRPRRFRQYGAGDVAGRSRSRARNPRQPEPAMRLRRFEDVVALGRRAARDRAEGAARTGRAPRPLRGGPHRAQPHRGRQPHHRQRPHPRTPAMDRRALDGGALLGSGRADPAREGRGRRARAQGGCRQPSARAGGAVEISRRPDRQRDRAHGEARRGRGNRDPSAKRMRLRHTRPKTTTICFNVKETVMRTSWD